MSSSLSCSVVGAMLSSATQHSRSWLMQATELTIPSRTLGTSFPQAPRLHICER